MNIHTPLLLLVAALLSGCQSYFGPTALNNTHPAYNQAIVSSLNQQMLLNLVRLKYRDHAYFLKVGSVTASMTFGGSVGMDTEINLGSGGNIIEPNLGFSYSDKPTISYTPLQGEDFLKNILSSISLEAILVMTQSGWSIERVFGLCVERMNDLRNAPRASGPTPGSVPEFKKFKRMLKLFRELQLTGDMEIGPDLNLDSKSIDLMIMFENEHVDPKVSAELGALLGFTHTEHKKSSRVRLSNNFLNPKPNQLTVRTRSIASLLFYLSQNIEIPQRHIDDGLVTITHTRQGAEFNWDDTPAGSMFKIRSSEDYPDNAYIAISYRGVWFYIADNDLQSKSTFMLLTQLFDLQAGQTEFTGPTLTLPVR